MNQRANHERAQAGSGSFAASGLDVDKDDLKRYSDFIHAKLYDLLLMATATAKANGRDIIQPWDLPITKGLQERIHEFVKLDEAIELQPILDRLAEAPQLDLATDDDTDQHLPLVAGGLTSDCPARSPSSTPSR